MFMFKTKVFALMYIDERLVFLLVTETIKEHNSNF